MTIDQSRPWLDLYDERVPADLPIPTSTPLESFAATVARFGDRPFLYYFDRTLSFREVDELSSALAAGLRARGVGRGDRVALYLQNDPDFAIAQLAAWKLGGASVSINPMLREQELEHILRDSGAVALVCLEELWDSVASKVVGSTSVSSVLLTRVDDWLADAAAGAPLSSADGCRLERMPDVLREHSGATVEDPGSALDDIACICYTSGTSGRPKGVAATHSNFAYSADVYRTWMAIDENDVFLCGAPIFHITGLIAGLALSYISGMSMILFHRFEAGACLRVAHEHRATFTVMAITAFQALMSHPDCPSVDLTSLTKVYSGGAPVTPAVAAEWQGITGHPIHNVYGLTETSGPTHMVPLGRTAPVDAESGAMSVGLPAPGAHVRTVDAEKLQDAEVGEPGEIWIKGPMVMKSYWGLPEATAEAFVDGYFRTGDVGIRDANGWFYVVDRLKDMINASGYKVWPREVEDFLLQHPAVREAAVVGVPDQYRGETVKAFVVLREGQSVTPDEVIAFCKQRMAAYKYPRLVEVVDELPKTASGKVLRRELRNATPASPAG